MTPRTRAIFRIFVAGLILVGTGASRASAGSFDSGQDRASGSSPDGVWTGFTEQNGKQVPFRLEVSHTGDQVQGALINGRKKAFSSGGSYTGGRLLLQFDYCATAIDATLKDGVLTGSFSKNAHTLPLTGRLNGELPAPSPNPPNIAGEWEVAVQGPKAESAWKLQVRQSGASVDAVIERIDGDTGNLYGVWRDGRFAVSHFTPAGPSYAELEPQSDGTLHLAVTTHGEAVQTLTARRPQIARSQGLAGPDDPLHHTALQNPTRPLSFRFPNLQGRLVSASDSEFRNRVVIVAIGGSWCPNCQDEAPFLESLYRKYHSRGLDVVDLSFEEQSQLANPTRLKAVIQKFGITYPVLLAGTPDQLDQTFPGVLNLNCWPTTFFIGKDGLVKAIHTGYAGPATGKDNSELERDTTALVERLLAGDRRSTGVAAAQVARTR